MAATKSTSKATKRYSRRKRTQPKPRKASAAVDPTFPDRYAVVVRGNCLAPLIPDRCRAVCDTRQPCSVGDVVVVHLKPEGVRPGHPPAILKRLAMAPPPGVTFPHVTGLDSEVVAVIIVEMDKPRKRIAIPCDYVQALHRVVGVVDGDKAEYSPGTGNLILSAGHYRELPPPKPAASDRRLPVYAAAE